MDRFIPSNDEMWRQLTFCGEELQRLRTALADREEEIDMELRKLLRPLSMIPVQGYHLDGTTIFWNEGSRLLYGYTAEEAEGKNLLDLIIPEDSREIVRQQMCTMFESGEPIPSAELVMKRKDGSLVSVYSCHVILKRVGRPTLLYCVDIDLSGIKQSEEERKAYQQRLTHAQKMEAVGQMAAGVAHEINNPINFINTNFVVLRNYFNDLLRLIDEYRRVYKMGDGDVAHDSIRAVEEEIRFDFLTEDIPSLFEECQRGFGRVEKIIHSMRRFAYVAQTEEFVECDINESIIEILTISANIYKYCADVITDFGEVPEIPCRPDLLKQVFLNLVVNSAQAIQSQERLQKGTISIKTFVEGSYVVCEFHDDGPGIPPENMSRIFEPFFTTKAPGEGVGLGLSICYEIIVKNHKGDFTVSSHEEEGTVFVVRLPLDIHSLDASE